MSSFPSKGILLTFRDAHHAPVHQVSGLFTECGGPYSRLRIFHHSRHAHITHRLVRAAFTFRHAGNTLRELVKLFPCGLKTVPQRITVKREPDDSKTYDLYTGAQVDGKDLPEGSHTTAKGSLILTLKAAYLDTLTVGDHKVTIAFEDGSATATIKIKEAAPAPTATPKPVPRTGDGSNPALWLSLAVAGLILIAGTVILWNRKKRCGK